MKNKKKWYKTWWGIIIIILIAISMIGYLVGNTEETDSNNENTNNTTEKQNNNSVTTEKNNVQAIYQDDEGINLFINRYNELYEPDITSNMLSKKHIAGSDRDNVVTITNNKLEINIYDNYSLNNEYNMSVYVGYKTNATATVDDYKVQFTKYIKLFDDTLLDEEIDNYWNDMISSYHSSYEINDIDIVTSTNNGTIQYFKFTKNLKL